jgi:TonB family protein
MKPAEIISRVEGVFTAFRTSREKRRDQERGYVRMANEVFEHPGGEAGSESMGLTKKMHECAASFFPEVYASVETAKKAGRQVIAPRMISAQQPLYPLRARMGSTEGKVWVAFVVGIYGLVDETKSLLDRESPFSKSAVKAVNKWRFKPGSIDGIPSPFLLVVPVRFRLRNEN